MLHDTRVCHHREQSTLPTHWHESYFKISAMQNQSIESRSLNKTVQTQNSTPHISKSLHNESTFFAEEIKSSVPISTASWSPFMRHPGFQTSEQPCGELRTYRRSAIYTPQRKWACVVTCRPVFLISATANQREGTQGMNHDSAVQAFRLAAEY